MNVRGTLSTAEWKRALHTRSSEVLRAINDYQFFPRHGSHSQVLQLESSYIPEARCNLASSGAEIRGQNSLAYADLRTWSALRIAMGAAPGAAVRHLIKKLGEEVIFEVASN